MTAPRYWMARMIVALEVLFAIVLVSWFEPQSLTAQAIERTGVAGWGFVALLGAACCVCISDVVVNDLLPERFSFHIAKSWRHLGLMIIALLLGLIGILVSFTFGFTTLLLVYWLNAGISAALAFLDAFARMRPR
jgi:hypothetical protein